MNDREKVIRGLEFTKEMVLFDPSTGECKEPENLNDLDKITYDACVGGISLLKEQEPKFIEIDGQFGGIKYGRCPKCGKGLNEEVYPHWCGFCGQAVKWND